MPWRESQVEEERFKFILEVQKGDQSFKELCYQFGISRPTGYKCWHTDHSSKPGQPPLAH